MADNQQSLVQLPNYETVEVLGSGVSATVYKARRNGTFYAVKRLKKDQIGLAPLFRKEAQTMARFNDPGLVRLYEIGEFEGLPYLVMEYIDGSSLEGHLA